MARQNAVLVFPVGFAHAPMAPEPKNERATVSGVKVRSARTDPASDAAIWAQIEAGQVFS